MLIGLAVLVAVGLALWPAPSDPPEVIEAAGARSATPREAVASSQSRVERVTAPRAVHAAAVDLFAGHSWYRPPPPPPPREAGPPPAPVAPPFPYSYMGQYARPGDRTVYFLQRGESVFDVQVGQVLDGVWNIDAVADGRMRLTYKPLQLQQVISVGSNP